MIFLTKISKQFGEKVLFKDIDLQIYLNDRIGLIGRNGSGKTTLFSMIIGEQEQDAGRIEKNKNMVIGCLKQEIVDNLSKPLLDEVVRGCPHINRLRERIDLLHEEIAQEKEIDKIQDYVERLGECQLEFESRRGYDREHQAKRILFGLGFRENDMERRIEEFSGGWRMRMSLAKLLLQEPDLLLLDEPTNHLDLESVIWLEEFLKNYQGAVMIISHDRTFLNNIVTSVIEIDQKSLFHYSGNYDDFIEQKETRQEVLEAAYKNQQKKIEATERFIEKFRYKATKSRQVQSRIKSIEKMEKIQVESSSPRFSITIPQAPASGKVVLEIKRVSKQYGEKVVYKDLSLMVNRGDRIALVGPNGSGKSTMLKIMAGVLPVDSGHVNLGHNVFRSYFAQHQLEILKPESTVLEEIDVCIGRDSKISARSYLGAFLFQGDEVFKKVAVLSGGEKTRLVLAKMLLQQPNFLLLDEPTNHLDIPSRDCLQEALSQYTGTICMISHDRIFINYLANKIIRLEQGQVEFFLGDYDYYLGQMEKKKEQTPGFLTDLTDASLTDKDKKAKNKEQKRVEAEKRNQKYKQTNTLRQESKKIQAQLSQVLEKIECLNKLFADPTYYQRPEFTKKLHEYKELEAKNEELTNRWTEVEARLEAIEQEFSQGNNL